MPDAHPALPNRLHFSLGGLGGPSWELDLNNGALVVSATRAGHVEGKETVVTPPVEAWSRFWQTVESIGVWQWRESYFNHDVLDGTQWELELTHAGRSVRCDGSNAYPGHDAPGYEQSPQFMQLLAALRVLTGIRRIG